MKRIFFQRKSFWFILVILLFAACVYPPFRLMREGGIIGERKWDCIFTILPTPYEVPEIDLAMLSVEAAAATPLAMGTSLIFLGYSDRFERSKCLEVGTLKVGLAVLKQSGVSQTFFSWRCWCL